MARLFAFASLAGLAACAGSASTLSFESRATWSNQAPFAWRLGARLAWRGRANEAAPTVADAHDEVPAAPAAAPACALSAACAWERRAREHALAQLGPGTALEEARP